MGRLMGDAIGLGLAATQLGVMHRLLVYRVGFDAPLVAVVNPASSGPPMRSRPGRRAVSACPVSRRRRAPAPRPRAARSDEHGDEILIEASGLEARVIQHEMDHLDGILIIDRTAREQRKEALRILREGADPLEPRVARRPAGEEAADAAAPSRATDRLNPSCERSILGHFDVRGRRARGARGSPHGPALVVTPPDRPRGRGRKVAPPPVAHRGARLGIELLQARTSTTAASLEQIDAVAPGAICVCQFGQLIREPLLSRSLCCSTSIPRCFRVGAEQPRSSVRS